MGYNEIAKKTNRRKRSNPEIRKSRKPLLMLGKQKMAAILSESRVSCCPKEAGITAACPGETGVTKVMEPPNADRAEKYSGCSLSPALRSPPAASYCPNPEGR